MTDYTWSDCDFAMAGFSKILNNKEEVYKPNIVHGKHTCINSFRIVEILMLS